MTHTEAERQNYYAQLRDIYGVNVLAGYFVDYTQALAEGGTRQFRPSLIELQAFEQFITSYGVESLFIRNPLFFMDASIINFTEAWNAGYSYEPDPHSFGTFFRDFGVAFIAEPFDMVMAFRAWQNGEADLFDMALSFGPITFTTATAIRSVLRNNSADEVAQMFRDIPRAGDGQFSILVNYQDILRHQPELLMLERLTDTLNPQTLHRITERFQNDTDMLSRIMRDPGLLPDNILSENSHRRITTHLTTGNSYRENNITYYFGGTRQESKVRLSFIDNGYEFPFGYNDLEVQSRFGQQLPTVDIIAQNPTTGAYVLAESKGTEIGDAVDQLRSTFNQLGNQVGVANLNIQSLEIHVPSNYENRLNRSYPRGLDGHFMDEDGYIYRITNGQIEYREVNGQRIKIEFVPPTLIPANP